MSSRCSVWFMDVHPWTDGFTCCWVITTVSDSGGQMVTLTWSQSRGDLFDGAIFCLHILGSGVKRSISVLNSCQATSGGGVVVCCFGKTTMTHFFAIFYIIFWYVSWYVCFKILVWHIFFSLSLLINRKMYYKTQHFHSWEWSTCSVL